MKKLRFTLSLGILLAGKVLFAQSPAAIQTYVDRYKDIAMEEMKRTGVPASITLAQGIVETVAGTSDLVLASNNHFGIKCKSTWTGESVRHDDDARGECFRKYPTPEDSYKDHSDFLRSGSRYAFLFRIDPTDFESWAYGLKKAGYATNPRYPQLLIRYIRDYQLQDYTLIALGRKAPESNEVLVKNNTSDNAATMATPAVVVATNKIGEASKKAVYPSGTFKINETNVVFIPKGTSFLAIADKYNIRLSRLFDFNDLQPQEETTEDQLIYLQRKRKVGANETHAVAVGENLYQIAQEEGIRLESLLSYNFLKPNMIPQAGEVLYLHKKAPAMPKLATATAIVTMVNNSSDLAKATTGQTTTEAPIASDNFIVHVVQPKETMYSISKKYAVKMDDVVKWNDLQSTDLKTGQQLRIKRM